MELEVYPYRGLGPIEFGMTTGEIRQAMAVDDVDELYDEGILYFGIDQEGDRCCLIEIVAPLSATLKGMDLLKTSIGNIRKWLEDEDNSAIYMLDGIISPKYGINFYSEDLLDEAINYPEAIRIFKKGFYDADSIEDYMRSQEIFFQREREKRA